MTRKGDLKTRRRRRAEGEIEPDDFFGDAQRRVFERKNHQVCAQARVAIHYAMSCDFSDEVIRDLCVVDVQPFPDASRLLITIGNWEVHGREAVLRRLKAITGHLRASVAGAVNRKKAPTLAFELVLAESIDDGRS